MLRPPCPDWVLTTTLVTGLGDQPSFIEADLCITAGFVFFTARRKLSPLPTPVRNMLGTMMGCCGIPSEGWSAKMISDCMGNIKLLRDMKGVLDNYDQALSSRLQC